ncbi:uncharacterized protein LOC113312210 [Papaver somniferum]|uniref:uncharacterized protein LOC113312210 n=1 Tax=Papaver somniferum TaxID=3469 RepID=UPI000E6FA384|nr:uncharacterized protein LOC113312210 [Papaver somniferum]
MGCFKIPVTTIQHLESLQRNFWWGHKANKGINFIAWSNFQKPKDLGGLGFRNLETFNRALISKIAWKICSNSDDLCTQILEAKYFRDINPLHIDKLSDSSSWVWKGIYRQIQTIKENSFRSVRCGTKIRIWLDKWVIGIDHPPDPAANIIVPSSLFFVSDLFLPGTMIWNAQLRKGMFTVKSAYKVLSSNTSEPVRNFQIGTEIWKCLWQCKIPYKVKKFAWKCLKDILPTRDKQCSRISVAELVAKKARVSGTSFEHSDDILACNLSS